MTSTTRHAHSLPPPCWRQITVKNTELALRICTARRIENQTLRRLTCPSTMLNLTRKSMPKLTLIREHDHNHIFRPNSATSHNNNYSNNNNNLNLPEQTRIIQRLLPLPPFIPLLKRQNIAVPIAKIRLLFLYHTSTSSNHTISLIPRLIPPRPPLPLHILQLPTCLSPLIRPHYMSMDLNYRHSRCQSQKGRCMPDRNSVFPHLLRL